MTTLTIKDLAHTEALDHQALASVRGGFGRSSGFYGCMPSYCYQPGYDGGSYDNSVTASQFIGQSQSVSNVNGNNVAFADNISSKVKPVQSANNTIFA